MNLEARNQMNCHQPAHVKSDPPHTAPLQERSGTRKGNENICSNQLK